MNEIIIVLKDGIIQDIFCTDSTIVVKIINLDDKVRGENFIHVIQWPDTQWDEETITFLANKKN